jgi:ribosomal protein L35AE/L33A
MKTLKFLLFAMFTLSMGMTCSKDDTQEQVLAGDCLLQPFSETYTLYKANPNSYFIKGEVVDVVQHGNKIKVIHDFKKNFEVDTIITVWGAGKINNRIDHLYSNNMTDTLLLLITKTDLSENLLCPQCEPYEQPDDYMTFNCHYSVLKLSGETVSGKITDTHRDSITFMSWTDFVMQFEVTKDTLFLNRR